MLHIIWKHNHWTHSLTPVSNSRFSWSYGKRPANSRSHVASQLSEHDRTLCGMTLPGRNKPWDKMMDLYVSVIYPNLLFVTVTCYLFFICKSNLIELSQQFYILSTYIMYQVEMGMFMRGLIFTDNIQNRPLTPIPDAWLWKVIHRGRFLR